MIITGARKSSTATGALALDGGTSVRSASIRTNLPPTEEDVQAAVAVLQSGVLSGPNHPEVNRFESLLAALWGTEQAVAVNSGTAAIHCILHSMDIGPGDEVIVPAHTFIASATPVLMTGATPVVVDVCDTTYCIDPAAVAAQVSDRTRAIVAVHINGHPAPVDQLPADIPIVSDACQAHGATLNGTSVAALGVASAFSFWQDKLITTGGEGGAVLTDDGAIAANTRLMRSHFQEQIAGTPNSHHTSLGFNYRITGAQAAMGHSQLGRLPELLETRKRHAARLTELLADAPGITPPVIRAGAEHVFWKFVVTLDPDRFRVDVRGFIRALAAEGVPAVPRYPVPLTRQPVLLEKARITPCPTAESLSDRLFTLPLPAADEDAADVDDIAEATLKVAAALHR